MSPSRPCTIGLTGGLASGKSTVARHLGKLGAAVIDADRVVHELYGAGQEGARAVATLFGEEMLGAGGAVDRQALGKRVLVDPRALEALKAAIHPMVRQRIEGWLGEVEEKIAVIEAALMVETGSYRSYDFLVVVTCREEQQLERAMARGMSEHRARQLLAAQMPFEEKRKHADLEIDNSAAAEDLIDRVQHAWDEITRRCGSLGVN